jgi:hypothetical protein
MRFIFALGLLMGMVIVMLAYLPAHAGTAKPSVTASETMQGVLVDNACAGGHKDDMASFVKTHTKDCALMPGCIASGYSLYTQDGQLLGFSPKSNKSIVAFLKGLNSTLRVEVKVKRTGEILELVSIKNHRA